MAGLLPPLLAQPLAPWAVALVLNGLLIALAQRLPLLTPAGWVHAGVLGTLLWGSLGWRGWLAVVAYLALGSAVTRMGFARKQADGLAERRGGRRGPENVWGSAFTGAVLALATTTALAPQRQVLLLGFAASFAAKLADTFGSEIGKRWGRTTVLITSLRPVPAGTEGAISAEGTAASAAGALLMAAVMAALGLISGSAALALVAAVGLGATLLESLIGATLQRRWSWLSNEWVNGLQTAVAAGMAIAGAALLQLRLQP
ncbi:MAG: TIGR00297 family protein [Cyanobacteriota bacterium]|nr:TIGR00297 family protein [Cyanobacteriota bacterium]